MSANDVATNTAVIGQPENRVDGILKVTGAATYAAEYDVPDLLHGHMVCSAIARGRIVSIDDSQALALRGVVAVYTHNNKPRTTRLGIKHKDTAAPPGQPLRWLHDATIHHSEQPIALVVAETVEIAREAAALLRVEYEVQSHVTDFAVALPTAKVPSSRRILTPQTPKPRGDAERAFSAAAFKVDATYHVGAEFHLPMELFATTVQWEGGGRITVFDKTQGSQNVQLYIRNVFAFSLRKIRVVNAYVGGAFGQGLRPQVSVFMAVLAAKALQRSVRVELSRAQMFHLGHRPETQQYVKLGANRAGQLQSMSHTAIGTTSRYEEHQETVVQWSSRLYKCDNVTLAYELVRLDIETPTDMRAPGAATGSFAIESAMDELAHEVGIDPIALRLVNYTDRDEDANREFTSKALRACYVQAAARFGWSARNSQPGSTKVGRELVGFGMASAVWEARMAPAPTRARATMFANGLVEITSSTTDIGTGTYTILAQIAAETLNVPMSRVRVKLGDSGFPLAQVEGSSWTAASTGSAVQRACEKLREKIAKSRGLLTKPLSAMGTVVPSFLESRRSVGYTHAAVFAEVRVDEQLGVIRVTRVVTGVAAGRILNPKTAGSQIKGGIVMGIGQALHEHSVMDHRFGRVMNANLVDYHIPCNADIQDIDVIFVDERDEKVSPIGAKGVGEIGSIGVAAAIANAVFNATGKRVRQLPITLDLLL